MSDDNKPTSQSKGGFWSTLPGVLTGVAGVITALGALIVALSQTEGIQGNDADSPTDSSQETNQPESVSTMQTSGSFPVYAHRSSEFINP